MKQLLVMALISMLCTAAPGIITCNTIHTGQQGEKKKLLCFCEYYLNILILKIIFY